MATTASTSMLLNPVWRLLGWLSVLLLCFTTNVFAGQVTLSWDASPGPDLKGYRLYYGQASRQNTPYPSFVDVGLGNKTTADGTACTTDASGAVTCTTTPTLLKDGTTYYFGVKAYNSLGTESGFTNEIYRTIGSSTMPPAASFSASTTSGLAVTFKDTSTGTPTNWCWTFGDSNNFCDSTAQNPSHTYNQAGTYTVTLTAGNAGGSNMAKRLSVTVSPLAAPVASFNASATSGIAPLAVTFTNTSTGTGTATAWSWNFGDGGTSTAKDPSHTFQTAKIYTVTLTASNSGVSTTATKTITVNAPTTAAPLAATFSASPTTSGTAPLTVQFTDTSTPTTGSTIASRSWNFGDSSSGTLNTSTAQSLSHTYTNPGTYTVTLTVKDTTGAQSVVTSNPNIQVNSPVKAGFKAAPTTGTAPLTVQFTDQSTTVTGTTLKSWSWTFGDSSSGTLNTSTAQNPSHTYNSAGTYTVTLVATNSAGRSNTTSGTITVSAATPTSSNSGLVAAYSFEEASGGTNDTIVVDASGKGNHGTRKEATRIDSGKFGKALSFDGINDWVTVNDSAALDLTTGMTLEAWVYPTDLSGKWRTALIKENSSSLAYALYANSDSNVPAADVNVSSYNTVKGTSSPALNAWIHLAATYDGVTVTDKRLRLYVNGTQVASKSLSGSATVSTGALRIGGNSMWGEFFKGYIDEVRIYNKALTATEIQTDMRTPVATSSQPKNLLGDDKVGTATDNSISQGMAVAFQTTALTAGMVTRLPVYVDANSTATQLVAGIYANNNGSPGTLLAQGTLKTPAAGWNWVPLPTTTVNASTSYWVAVLNPKDTTLSKLTLRAKEGSALRATSQATTLTTLPGTWTSSTTSSGNPLSAYGAGY